LGEADLKNILIKVIIKRLDLFCRVPSSVDCCNSGSSANLVAHLVYYLVGYLSLACIHISYLKIQKQVLLGFFSAYQSFFQSWKTRASAQKYIKQCSQTYTSRWSSKHRQLSVYRCPRCVYRNVLDCPNSNREVLQTVASFIHCHHTRPIFRQTFSASPRFWAYTHKIWPSLKDVHISAFYWWLWSSPQWSG